MTYFGVFLLAFVEVGLGPFLGSSPRSGGRGFGLDGGLVDPVGVEEAGGTNPLKSSNEESERVPVLELSDSPSPVGGGDGKFRGFLALIGPLIVVWRSKHL